ncbi:MAG TPA: hypothetical protein PLB91_01275 [Spirochaetales bacterium]|nr:hypothetical protein [Spirochaetales bacterium]
MKARHALRGLCCAALVSSAALSCELSSSLLSESERSGLYEVKLKSGGALLDNGSLLEAGSSIAANVSRLTGAAEIAFLELGLEGSPAFLKLAGPAAGLAGSAAAKDAAKDAAGSTQVDAIEGELPPLELPADLPPGAYWLRLQLSSAEGRSLQKSSLLVFVGLPQPRIEGVSVYPPSIGPGQAVLLSLDTSPTRAGDPWIRWSRDGLAFAEGPLSGGFGRVVWAAPRLEGAYALSVEAFPAAPPEGSAFSFRAAARQELKAMVKEASAAAADEFDDALSFLSLLRLDGSFDDAGVRARLKAPVPLGSPLLDVYPGGFGYSFGPDAGLSLPGLMPPAYEGRSAAFSLVLRLATREEGGRLLRFSSEDGSYLLELGLEGGKPFVSLASGGETARSLAPLALEPAAHTIVACLQPEEGRTQVTWVLDGLRVEAPSLPPLPPPPEGSALLGGPGSIAGVYDGFGLMSAAGSSRPLAPPSYRLASRRRWKASLALAEAFEDGLLPPGVSARGGASASVGAVRFKGDGSLAFAPPLKLDLPYVVEADFAGPSRGLSLVLQDPSGLRLLAVTPSGAAFDGSGTSLGSLPVAAGKLAFVLSPSRGGFRLASPSGGEALRVPAEGSLLAGPFTLLVEGEGADDAALARILAREASR